MLPSSSPLDSDGLARARTLEGFELPVIERYFPGYEGAMRRAFGG